MNYKAWKRALVNAMQIADVGTFDQQRAVRQTLELP